jgi:peptidoglycan glycosyltransferase
VVIDSRSGGLLAVASYPFPSLNGHSIGEADSADVWLDRARYGLYAPGSTFKLVTAAAALDQGLRPSELTFVCGPLRDGRVGARIPGWSRPVRDDVRDTRPHGALRLHDAFVHSCNAYFAQLAVRVGARSLQDVATRLGMSTAPGSSLPRLRETLPQAGYGQGDVVTTPLRMARAVAAVAAGGVLRDVVWETPSTERPAGRLLSGEASSVLAEYLRDSVLSGTGRSLRGHPLRIAGKTGTAEVAGAASHAWFVGFAPFAGADPPIAFAVIVENAGYGASAAAPIAGEIVSAAADVGLIR